MAALAVQQQEREKARAEERAKFEAEQREREKARAKERAKFEAEQRERDKARAEEKAERDRDRAAADAKFDAILKIIREDRDKGMRHRDQAADQPKKSA